MKIKLRFVVLVAFVMTFSWYCSEAVNPFEPDNQTEEVEIINRRFVPSTLNVSVGTTVRWINKDDLTSGDAHTVDSGKENQVTPITNLFNLTFTKKNESHEFTFNSTGIFDYYCALHGETGKVIVD